MIRKSRLLYEIGGKTEKKQNVTILKQFWKGLTFGERQRSSAVMPSKV